ncbi:MAG: mannose-1-phosphate guanylyltransferase [Rhodospirillaceae bacterium]|nr:mannose-1-phosphate guanylyltransferase [Rhodospirillaceae bacterium]|tara:strand:- start:4165 stop:4842 length:678 start_codon:yes stop_codon:yes gene_type:complete
MKAMLLAAGKGKRMGALTATYPKPLLSLGTETLIHRHLRKLAQSGITEIVINISHCGDKLRHSVGDVTEWGQKISYSDEGSSPLETAGGIVKALPLLGSDPFIVISSDIVTDFDFKILLSKEKSGYLVLVPNPAHHQIGDFGMEITGKLTKRPPLYTYSGIALLDESCFRGFVKDVMPLRNVFDSEVVKETLHGIIYDGFWKDVGTPERLEDARDAVASLENHFY